MNKEYYKNIRNKRVNLIDIQEAYEYKVWHLPGSINIPYDELISNHRRYLNKSSVYYIYCKTGQLSKRIVVVLSYLGYNTIMLEV